MDWIHRPHVDSNLRCRLLSQSILPTLMVLNTFAAMMALRGTGQSWRTSFGMGVGLAQVGEFAFVLTLLGVEANVLESQTYERIVLLAIGSLTATPICRWGLRWTDDTESESEAVHPRDSDTGHVIVVGAGPIGKSVIERLHQSGRTPAWLT
jgi:CPA2 family monovalent cation:H+ antiporter-2